MAETTFGKDFPFVEEGEIREFDCTKDDAEYVWHRDAEEREIEIIEGEGGSREVVEGEFEGQEFW